jgi:hypothetical protein
MSVNTDPCSDCLVKGNLKLCIDSECNIHEAWYVSALKKEVLAQQPTNSIKAEIAALANEVESLPTPIYPVTQSNLINKLRQLSAV